MAPLRIAGAACVYGSRTCRSASFRDDTGGCDVPVSSSGCWTALKPMVDFASKSGRHGLKAQAVRGRGPRQGAAGALPAAPCRPNPPCKVSPPKPATLKAGRSNRRAPAAGADRKTQALRRRARPGRGPVRARLIRRGRADPTGAVQARGLPVRLWRVGPAAYGHLRRGGAPDHGAQRLPRAHRGRDPHAVDRVLRRHGRPAEDPVQPAQRRKPGAGPRQAGVVRARSLRRVRELRGAQQRPGPRLPRQFRLRLHLHVVHRDLQVRPLRRGAAEDAGAVRRDPGDHAADARRRAARHLFALPADQPEDRQGAAGPDAGARRRGGHDHLRGRRWNPDRGSGGGSPAAT